MINLNELTPHHPTFHNIVASYLPHTFAGSPQTSNHSGNNFRQARNHQTIRKTTFAERGETRILYTCSITKNGMHKKMHTTFYLNVMLFYLLTRSLTCSEGSYNPGRVLVCGLNLPHLISKQGG